MSRGGGSGKSGIREIMQPRAGLPAASAFDRPRPLPLRKTHSDARFRLARDGILIRRVAVRLAREHAEWLPRPRVVSHPFATLAA